MNKTTTVLIAWAFIMLLANIGCQSTQTEPAKLPEFSSDGDLVLVKDGESLVPIVVFEGAPPYIRRAADELAVYIEKTSGAKPEVIEGTPDPLPKHAIWVGYQPILDDLFPDVDFEFKNPEEILIAANGNHLVIAGRDVWDPEHLQVTLGRRHIDGLQQEYGTVNAVYTFLQDCLGVRWLFPGELGEDVTKSDTIAFNSFEYRYHPQFRARAGMFVIYMLHRQLPGYEWARLQRIQLDSLPVSGGHGFTKWWRRFHEDHPEYLALQADGTRGTWPGPLDGFHAGCYVKMCKSNPEVWKQWLNDVADQLEKNPYLRVFNAAANDGGYEGYCVCDSCLGWDNQKAGKLLFRWAGLRKEYVTMSDRQITLANTLGRLLKKRYPDKDYYVSVCAYGNSRLPPAAAVPDDNVIVLGVFGFHNQSPLIRRASFDNRKLNHLELFNSWTDVAKNFIWRPNMGGAAGWHRGYPDCAPHRAIEDLKMVADKGVVGVYFDAIYGHWANQAPHYYMLAQMAWNPYADGEAILTDYYQRGYGPAAKTMTNYWTLIEKASGEIKYDKKSQNEVWDADFYKKGYALLDQAAKETENADPVYAKRVDFVRSGLDYLRLFKDTEPLIERLRESKGKDADAEAKARANWVEIAKIPQKYPYAVLWTYVKPGASRSKGLHPDDVLGQFKKKKDPKDHILGKE